MESIKEFLIKVTQELLYNIVFEANEIEYDVLSEHFVNKTRHRPMDFFGYGNKTGREWFEFIEEIPGLKGCRNSRKVSIAKNGNNNVNDGDKDAECVYKIFNTTILKENGANSSNYSVAKYREMLLLKCCSIMKPNLSDLGRCKDINRNTPLHYIAALSGITYDCSTLVKYLLQAGVDPLATNSQRQTFLHVILSRVKWLPNEKRLSSVFEDERVGITKWFVEDRVELLHLLSEELSCAETFSLMNIQDRLGRTALHEFAIASPIEEQNFEEGLICRQLINLGATVGVADNNGASPLHYAFNPQVFVTLMRCNVAKDVDGNNALLYILKSLLNIAFTKTSVSRELISESRVRVMITQKRSVYKAVMVLKNLSHLGILEWHDLREYCWSPDIIGNVAVTIILIGIRLASYMYILETESENLEEEVHLEDPFLLRSLLVKLLRIIVPSGSPRELKQQNERGQGFLHVLLDMQNSYRKHEIIEDAAILQSLEILLENGVPVNDVDSKGRTPLDITYEHKTQNLYKKCAEMLKDKGAIVGNNYCSPLQLCLSLNDRMNNLHLHNETRKLLSCPNRHLTSANLLTQSNNSVAMIGRYRYLNEDSIGSGAFSNVFVAIKDENVDGTSRGKIECRAFALKRLDKAKINPREIQREITTLLSISGQCENIITCHESLEDPFFQYLCLDLMDGDLNEFVANEGVNKVLKQDPAFPIQATKEVINGLAYLHEHKFIHRDLKPGNLLYRTDPSLHFKIADFGLTKNMSTFSTMTSTVGSGIAMAPGTRCWMAPELVSMKSKEHTTMSDVFSFGLVLHYLLTLGKHPFAKGIEERAHVIERNIEEMQIHLHNALHPEAKDFFLSILQQDPLSRPPVNKLIHQPFLWSESTKINFLKAVGDQPEAEKPAIHLNSALEQGLQKTQTGRSFSTIHWSVPIQSLYDEITKAWRHKKYRTDKLIDLIRFIRNAYAHRQDKSLKVQEDLDKNIFLRMYPHLVLDVFNVVHELGYKTRPNIVQALSMAI